MTSHTLVLTHADEHTFVTAVDVYTDETTRFDSITHLRCVHII